MTFNTIQTAGQRIAERSLTNWSESPVISLQAPSEFDDVVDRIRKLAARTFGEALEFDATTPMRAGFAYRPAI